MTTGLGPVRATCKKQKKNTFDGQIKPSKYVKWQSIAFYRGFITCSGAILQNCFCH